MPTPINETHFLEGGGLSDNTVYSLTEDMTIYTPFALAPGSTGVGIYVEGNGHTLTIEVGSPQTWDGLCWFFVRFNNLGIDGSANSVTLSPAAGWFFANGADGGATNCWSNGRIGGDCGGIFGAGSSAGTAENCYSLGQIYGLTAGGIFGSGGSGTATNCYSEGHIGAGCGGIFGAGSAGTATGCHSLGPISELGAGGIFANGADGTATATNCYSVGIMGENCGGIFGVSSSGTATNCYSLGGISGTNASGIFGYSSTGTAINCYSAGSLSGSTNGGIFYDGEGTATNCYFANGSWSDTAASAALAATNFIVPSLFVSPWVGNGGAPFTLAITTGIPDRDYRIKDPLTQAPIPEYSINVNGGDPYFVALGSEAVLINFDASTNSVTCSDGLLYSFSLTNNNPITFSELTQVSQGQAIVITQAWLSTNGYTLNPINTYTLGENITVTQPFDVSDPGLVFDGSGNKITINASTWSGLFNKVTAVQNLGVDGATNSVSLNEAAGWFFADGVGGSATNCWSTGSIGNLGGGIFGNGGTGTATNCGSSGSIGVNGGGIFGANGSGTATNCYSLGDIGSGAGGIFGYGASYGPAINCYSAGTIAPESGGIYATNGVEITCYAANGNWSDTAARAALAPNFIVPSLFVSPWASNGGAPFTLTSTTGIPNGNYYIRDPVSLAAVPASLININGGNPQLVVIGGDPVAITVGVTLTAFCSDGCFYTYSLTSLSPLTFSGLTKVPQAINITQEWMNMYGATYNPSSGTYTLTTLNDLNTYTLAENITLAQPFRVIGSPVVEGNSHKITIEPYPPGSPWPGLFNTGAIVKNLSVDGSANSVSLSPASGWFFASGGVGSATNCWSSGSIGNNCGGIFGANGGGTATNCYSLGDVVGPAAGGIFGVYSTGTATNCYSAGVVAPGSYGIYATNNSTATNCYFANGSWTDTAANMDLSGVPLVDNTIWSYNGGNPYTLSPLDGSGNPVSTAPTTTLSTAFVNSGTLPPSGTAPSIVAAVLAATSNSAKIKSLVAFVAADAHVTGSTVGFAALAALSGQVIPLDMSGSEAVYSHFDWTNNTNAAALQALPLVVSVPDTTTTPGTNLIVFPPTGNNNLIAINTTVDASYNFILPPSVPQITSGYGINVVSDVQYFISPLSGTPLAIETGTVLTVTDMSGGSYSTTILDLDLATTGAEVTPPPPSPPPPSTPQTILITQQWIDASGYALDATNTYLLYETISVSQPFNVSGSGLVFNGLNNSVNVSSGSAWAGLFSGDGITVTNLTMNALGTTLATGAGMMFASGTTNSTATWCTIQANGGLFGSACVGCTATHCMNGQGAVAENGGSIFGAGCISCSAVTCNSSALLAGSNAGGIFGADASGCNATGCFYNLLGKNSTFGVFAGCGGIFGNSCLDVSATDCATNCPIADGVVDGALIGGIFGTNCTGSMSNCYFVSADISGNVTCNAYGAGSTIAGSSTSDPVFNGSNAIAAVGDLNPQSPPGLIGGNSITACAAVLVAAAPSVAFNLLTAAIGQGTYAITEQSIVLGAAYAVKYSGNRAIYGVIQPGTVMEISASFAETYYSLFPTMGDLGSDPRSLDLTIITPSSSSVLPAISTTKNTLIVIGDDPCTITTLSDTITATAVNGVPLVAGRNMVFYQSANSPYCKVYGTELLVGPRLSGYLTNAAKIVEDMIASPSTAVAAGRAYGMNNAALILAAATAGTTSKSTSIYTFLANAIGAQSATFSAGQAASIYQNFESKNTDTTRSLQVSIPNAGVVNIGSTTNNNMVLIDISLNATYTFAAPILSTYSLTVANTVQTLNGPTGSTVLALDGTVTLKDTAGNSYILTIRDLDTAWSMSVVSGPICFFGNAPVLTPSGYRRMDSLRIGDLVSTPAGPVAIERVFKKDYAASATTNPYVIPKGTLGATKRLLISPNHRVAVGGKMVEACDPSLGLEQVTMNGTLTYYNLQLPGWANMAVAGVEVESLAPVKRLVISMADFAKIMTKKFGPAWRQNPSIERTCRFLPDGNVDVPVLYK